MLPREDQLLKMSLSEMEHLLHGCFPGSDTWNVIWPVYESKKRRVEAKRTYICFGISTAIGVAALVRPLFTAPENRPAPPPVVNAPLAKDLLSLFDTNPALEKCLKAINANDPLGVRTNDAEDQHRQACIARYSKPQQ